MSGHSKWSTIKREKGAKDAKRGAVFTKIGNQIAIAARAGTDPSVNSALALAIDKAKAANMPMANIQRAIDRVSDKNAAQLEEVVYEGYGPGGVAVIVEAATDNKNRTYPEVRNAFSKNGGTIAEAGSVAFQFNRQGAISAQFDGNSDDALLTALDCGAEDVSEDASEYQIVTDMKQLHSVSQQLASNGFTINEAELRYIPSAVVEIDDAEVARKITKLIDALDELDDVVATHFNAVINETA